MFFLPNVSVAGVGGRLPQASIAAHFRRKGCAKDPASPALRARRLWPGGTIFKWFPHQRHLIIARFPHPKSLSYDLE